MAARSNVVLINVVGTAAAAWPGGATLTVSVVKKFEPVRYTVCCAEPCKDVNGSMPVSVASAALETLMVAVPVFDGSAAEAAVIVTLVGFVEGAVYTPLVEISPMVVFPPAILFTCQLTP